MVATPWGDSESLRAGRLRPGPGNSREATEKNQRERLFGAMVASVAAKGYGLTTVADLAEISGVSSRTFYDMFADKKACFVAALEAMVEAAILYAAATTDRISRVAEAGDWDERARRGFDGFAEMIVVQPAAARMALIEAYAAGADALVPVEQATAGFEMLARQTLEESPERAEMPAEMISAHIGAMRDIASTRLRQGRERELPSVMDEIWDVIRSYRPPPQPLKGGRLATAGPESHAAHDHAERALHAFSIEVAEKGYAKTTVDGAISRAGMSATTFYANFDGKQDAMLAAVDSAAAQMVAAVMPAFRRGGDWADGVRAGFGAMFSFLASRPALAQLLMVEIYAAGGDAVERRVEATEPLRKLLARGYERAPGLPAIIAEVISGGVYTLAYRQIRDKGPQALPALAPICTYIALAPFLGAEEACRAANGDGRGRAGVDTSARI